MGLALITKPAEKAIALEELKEQARIDGTDEDALLSDLIDSSTEFCQEFTRRQFLTATYRLDLPKFTNVIRLPRAPLQSATSVNYIDENGALQTLGTDIYDEDKASEPGAIRKAFNKFWPVTRRVFNAVQITFVAGWSKQEDIPAPIRQAVKMLAASHYENREAVSVLPPGAQAVEIPMAVRALLWSQRILELR